MKKLLYIIVIVVGILENNDGMHKSLDSRLAIKVPKLQIVLPELKESERPLSPRSLYDRGLDFLLHSDGEEKLYGAVLILRSAQLGCVTALDYFSYSCNIQQPDEKSEEQLIQALINSSSENL